jgi:hypothetical protein
VTDLVIFRRQFIQTLLNDVITVQVLNEHNNVQTERNNDRMNLAMVSMISLRPTATLSVDRRKKDYESYLPVSLWIGNQSFFELLSSRAY